MDITPRVPEGHQFINAYGDGRIRISGIVYEVPVLVFPERVERWNVDGIDALDADSLGILASYEPKVEVLIIGCGPRLVRLSDEIRLALRRMGISVDTMDTGAACRTYNVLMVEGRRVAAALIPV